MLVRLITVALTLLLAQVGLSAVALNGPALIAAEAHAAFGGKVKNIRIRQRNNSQGYGVIVIVKDDTDSEVNDAYRAGVDLSNSDGTGAFTIDVSDTSKVVDRHVWEGVLFEESGAPLHLPHRLRRSAHAGLLAGHRARPARGPV